MLMTDEEANAAIAALPNEIRVSTHAFGPYIWRRVGSRAYVRKDGRHTTLFEWEAPCAFCSTPVQVIATVGQTTIAKNIRFNRPTCPTPKQSQLLAYERALGYGRFRRLGATPAFWPRVSKLRKSAQSGRSV
jgi:hypothetical protein